MAAPVCSPPPTFPTQPDPAELYVPGTALRDQKRWEEWDRQYWARLEESLKQAPKRPEPDPDEMMDRYPTPGYQTTRWYYPEYEAKREAKRRVRQQNPSRHINGLPSGRLNSKRKQASCNEETDGEPGQANPCNRGQEQEVTGDAAFLLESIENQAQLEGIQFIESEDEGYGIPPSNTMEKRKQTNWGVEADSEDETYGVPPRDEYRRQRRRNDWNVAEDSEDGTYGIPPTGAYSRQRRWNDWNVAEDSEDGTYGIPPTGAFEAPNKRRKSTHDDTEGDARVGTGVGAEAEQVKRPKDKAVRKKKKIGPRRPLTRSIRRTTGVQTISLDLNKRGQIIYHARGEEDRVMTHKEWWKENDWEGPSNTAQAIKARYPLAPEWDLDTRRGFSPEAEEEEEL